MGNRAWVVAMCTVLLLGGGAVWPEVASAQPDANSQTYAIPAGDLNSALRQFSQQSRVQLIYPTEIADGKKSAGLSGSYTPAEALRRLLSGSGLESVQVNDKTVVLKKVPAPSRAPAPKPSSSPAEQESNVTELPSIMVVGERTLNMDIARSRDDIQPYVILDRAVIEQSAATNLEDLLRQRLPMNTQRDSATQDPGIGNISAINLRGLGTNQTLILVDGHRVPSSYSFGFPNQPDINGIPLAAVERVEVLPTTASGIYGGSATGGVINIVLRRDYVGAETKTTYENSFDGGGAQRRFDFSSGFTIEGGNTNVLVTASYADTNPMTNGDRDFFRSGRQQILTNNPSFFTSAFFPPLGATTNIRSMDGTPLFGPGTPSFTSVPVGYAGGSGLAPLLANAGRYNFDLADSAQTGGRNAGLFKGITVKSFNATLRRQFGDAVETFLEASASSNSSQFPLSLSAGSYTLNADAPNNPFGQAVNVTVPLNFADGSGKAESETRRILGGVLVRLPGDWVAEADYTYATSSFNTNKDNFRLLPGAEDALIANGTIDVLRDTALYPPDFSAITFTRFSQSPSRSTLKDISLRAAGSMLRLPAGDPTLTLLLERRDESFNDFFFHDIVGEVVSTTLYPSRSQQIDSAYAEMKLPLLGEKDPFPGSQELEAQIAIRHDRYKIQGVTDSVVVGSASPIVRITSNISSTNPTFGFRYQPLRALTFRASYGTGFLPPSVVELVSNPTPFVFPGGALFDPRRNERTGVFDATFGGNPRLMPEESESFSAGLIFTPQALQGLRISVDYTKINKRDNIASLDTQTVINNELLLPGRVTRGPANGDPSGVGPITAVDITSINISRAQVEAYDVALDYRLDTARFGSFDFFALGTWQTHYRTQVVTGTPVVENVGMNGFPLKFKGNAGVTWKWRNWTAGSVSRYFDDYRLSTDDPEIILNQGGPRVNSQLFHDIFVGYRLPRENARFLGQSADFEIQAGVKNALNDEPAFDASQISRYYSSYGDPRMATYYVTLKGSF